jgi:hypothetical protein
MEKKSLRLFENGISASKTDETGRQFRVSFNEEFQEIQSETQILHTARMSRTEIDGNIGVTGP